MPGSISPYATGRVLLDYIYRHQKEIALHEDDDNRSAVTGWKIQQHLTASKVTPANDEYELIASEFEALLMIDQGKAGRLLDELREQFARAATTRA